MRRRGEIEFPDDDEEAAKTPLGQADSDYDGTEWTSADVKLYVPDLTSRTGWSGYWINRREKTRPTGRRIGFRREPPA